MSPTKKLDQITSDIPRDVARKHIVSIYTWV